MPGNLTITKSSESFYLTPAPLISISTQRLGNKYASFGNRYNIQLNGFILKHGSNGENPFPQVIQEQRRLVNIFETREDDSEPIKVEITPDGDNPEISFYVRLESINFEEGTYANGLCKYTINLVSEKEASCCGDQPPKENLLEDFNESWSFDLDTNHGYGEQAGQYAELISPRSYVLTRTVNATGRNFPQKSLNQAKANSILIDTNDLNDKPAWLQAKEFLNNGYHNTAAEILQNNPFTGTIFPSDITFQAFNHARTFSVDKGGGSCTMVDTFVLARAGSQALENYTMNITSSRDAPYVKVSIDGSIRGLSSANQTFDNFDDNNNNILYVNARNHYNLISGTGSFGINSTIYKRASAAVGQTLNSQPMSISLGTNQVTGEITYNVEFDNRPSNFFSNVTYENISVNDTYPGDVFATIPVLGRPTGPILQFTFGRTEYKRDISIELLLDYTDIGYNADRASLLLRKPSINEPTRSELNTLIQYLSPMNEPGIRKYFLSPPQESWNPKEGRYTLSLGWTYELSE
jgi:hypothetical protein